MPDGLTAAHRSLRFGTRVKVTNPRTGASTVVIINDRGPFTRGRDIDLSRGAARAIGLSGVGKIFSQIQCCQPEQTLPPIFVVVSEQNIDEIVVINAPQTARI